MKRVSIIQSCYIPWRGFFDLLSRCDEYIIYDQVAYRRRHWHNRNQIKTAQGPIWLTIPTSAEYTQPIDQVEVKSGWSSKHWKTIESTFARCPFFSDTAPWLFDLYERAGNETLLTNVNEIFIRAIAARLNLKTHIVRDASYSPEGSRSERLLSTCLAASATHYLSGPTAKSYLETDLFADAGIEVDWMDYDGYLQYPQNHGSFVSEVSIIDVFFNLGPDAPSAFERRRDHVCCPR